MHVLSLLTVDTIVNSFQQSSEVSTYIALFYILSTYFYTYVDNIIIHCINIRPYHHIRTWLRLGKLHIRSGPRPQQTGGRHEGLGLVGLAWTTRASGHILSDRNPEVEGKRAHFEDVPPAVVLKRIFFIT